MTLPQLENRRPSARTVTDAHVMDALRATVGAPEGMYGRRKTTAYLRRQGHQVAIPPQEYETAYYAHVRASQPAMPQTRSRRHTPERFSSPFAAQLTRGVPTV